MTHTKETLGHDPLSVSREEIFALKEGNRHLRSQGMQAFALENKGEDLRALVNGMSSFETLSNGVSIRIDSREEGKREDVNYEKLLQIHENALSLMKTAQATTSAIRDDDAMYDIYSGSADALQSYIGTFKPEVYETGEGIQVFENSMERIYKAGKYPEDPRSVLIKKTDYRGGGREVIYEDFNKLDAEKQMEIRRRIKEIGLEVAHATAAGIDFARAYQRFREEIKKKQTPELAAIHQKMLQMTIECANVDGDDHAKAIKAGEGFGMEPTSIIHMSQFLRSLGNGRGGHQLTAYFAAPENVRSWIESILREAKADSKDKFTGKTDEKLVKEFADALNGVVIERAPSRVDPKKEAGKKATINATKQGLLGKLGSLFGIGTRVNQDKDIKY